VLSPDRPSIAIAGRHARSDKDAFAWLRALNRQLPTRKYEAAFRIAVRLADHFNGATGQCNPTIETLAITANLSRRGADKGLRDLRELGWIASEGTGGRGNSSQHFLLLDHVETTHGDARFEDQNHAPARSKPRTSVRAKNENPENSEIPPAPLRGEIVAVDLDTFDADLADLAASYPIPIANLPKTRASLATWPHERRRELVLAARRYRDFLRDQASKGARRAARDLHRWIALGEWEGYAPTKPPVTTAPRPRSDEEWRRHLEKLAANPANPRSWDESELGPPPFKPGCLAPPRLIEEIGLIDIAKRRTA
jgi:hypothetical protein